MADQAYLNIQANSDQLTLQVSGAWVRPNWQQLRQACAQIKPDYPTNKPAQINLSNLTSFDTIGALLLLEALEPLKARNISYEFIEAEPAYLSLLERVEKMGGDVPEFTAPKSSAIDFIARVGKGVVEFGLEGLRMINFFGQACYSFGRILRNPRRLRLTSTLYHLEQTGINALPIVGLLAFLIGVVLAYQSAEQLQKFGAELLTVNLLGLSVLREIGVLITAIILAGRSGSAFTAQIGTMKVNQEIDAMETMGMHPMDLLAMPRIIALSISLPLLTFYACMAALLGGAVMCWALLDITFGQYVRQLQSAISIQHLWVGMIKAPFFAVIIALVGCYQGMRVTGSAASVGRRTTAAVVEAIFLVIVGDAFFSILFSIMGV